MAIVVITLVDTEDGVVAVNLLAEPAMSPGMPLGDMTPAQAAAVSVIGTMHAKSNEPQEASRILQLKD